MMEPEYYQDHESKSFTPNIDSLKERSSIAINIADKLYDISSDFYAFYGDNTSLGKADKWAEMAYKYFPYDTKYYFNHATILRSMGKDQKAEEVLQQMKTLPFYDEMANTRATY